MGRIIEKRRWKCKNCGAVTLEPSLLTAPSPFCDTVELTACPECRQCDEGFYPLCDEDGCNAEAGCGWPTGDDSDQWGGYRNTCYKHMKPNASLSGGHAQAQEETKSGVCPSARSDC